MNDFDRNVWCVLGIPLDAVDLAGAIQAIHQSIETRGKLFISTPNLNFVTTAIKDATFRKTLTNSELCLIDGMPLLWVARLLGTDIKKKSSGSDLFEQLRFLPRKNRDKVRIYFFGGEGEIGRFACETLSSEVGELECAGSLNPGFGSIDELSRSEIIDQLNSVEYDFLVVALGARKGQVWIDRNRDKFTVPVICHLGAVINFVAGKVDRAPSWMQKTGLEWVWRIYQEPALWRRYFTDGIGFLVLLLIRVLPYYFWLRMNRKAIQTADMMSFDVVEREHRITLRIKGACLSTTIFPLREIFRTISSQTKDVTLDLQHVTHIDGAFLGLCLLLHKHVESRQNSLEISLLTTEIRRIFRWHCVEYLI